MRCSLTAVLLLALTSGIAGVRAAGGDGQTTTPPQGALEPQSTSPSQGTASQTPGAPPAPAPVTPQTVVSPPPLGRVFASEQGLIFNAIKPDKAADFETVIAKLRAALANSKDPVRNQQGWGWKIYKAAEPGPNNSVLYVFVMDPAVKGADYGVAKILSEAYPTEITDLYRMYTGAFATAGQTILNLQPIQGTKEPGNEGTKAPQSPSPRVP